MTLDEFNARQAEILVRLPEELREVASHMAHDSDHAYGYQEVLINLRDLVACLEGPVREYDRRMEQLGQDRAQD